MIPLKKILPALIACTVLCSQGAALKKPNKARLERIAGSIGNMHKSRLTIIDRAGQSREFLLGRDTKITLDGKTQGTTGRFQPGTIVLNAVYDVKTTVLKTLDLKSVLPPAPAPTARIGRMSGEIASTDVFKGTVSLRAGSKTFVFSVTDDTTITRLGSGELGAAATLDLLQVGDQAEISSSDGKTATSIKARSPD